MMIVSSLFAQSIKIDLIPDSPVAGENFNVIFQINSKEGDDPIINFDPRNVEVLTREQTGTSTKTTYINGNLTVERTITVSYEMIAPKARTVRLSNINVEIAGNVIKHPDFRFKVLREQKKERDIFVRAEVDKSEVFVGESIVVRYYLYNRVRVLSMDIKKFPNLDKFLKRFHQETTSSERVQLNNGLYERRIIYSAQLYSNKIGKSRVDPITISVTYPYGRGANNPFSSFGFRSTRTRKLTLISKSVDINVKALPNDPPSGFSGLVGDHEVGFTINKNKFLVNEPIEMNLSVEGPGALELYEEPKLFSSSKVENFDSTSDFVVNKNFTSTKSFKITYLAREPGIIPKRSFPLVFFDPDSLRFITKTILIPQIKIAGTSISEVKNNESNKDSKPSIQKPLPIESLELDLSPAYKIKNTLVYNKITLLVLALSLLTLYIGFKVFRSISFKLRDVSLSIYQQVEKGGADYLQFYELVQEVGKGNSLGSIISKSTLQSSVKDDLTSALNKLDDAYKNGKKIKVSLKKKTLNSIKEYAK